MNSKQLLKRICYSAILTMSMSLVLPNMVFANFHSTKDTKQETIINLSSDALKQSYYLNISGSHGLKGSIKINGKTIKILVGTDIHIRLSHLLKKGKNIVEVTGSYNSSGSGLQIEFIGPDTQISQESVDNGKIRHNLIIYVE
ncbi:hypothetical protein H6G06_26535 [Anabaena sphaerica FACHB-251]|uniref:Uncharacterized protein n=1 Tax=Anabaena sphaerica FACHB-251 TaxID=2692883 RepID=A0A926WMW9_9NOST|nr:hypothetical protein [Anabaena sphaerica]MBD2296935.1 hypothetical protein [Anabaena sphaerica FACHB-251]